MAEWVGFTLSGINFESLPKMLSETKRPPLREDLFISGGVGGIYPVGHKLRIPSQLYCHKEKDPTS